MMTIANQPSARELENGGFADRRVFALWKIRAEPIGPLYQPKA
jgi:hypothetical protein